MRHYTRSTRLAVSITSAGPPLDRLADAAHAAGADLVELRVDLIGDVAHVERLLQQPRRPSTILTIRPVAEGGEWTGDESERIALLARLARHRPGYVDLEYAAWRRSAATRRTIGVVCELQPRQEAPGRVFDLAAGRRNRLILSRHDLRGTPESLSVILDRLAATPAGIIKAVFTARDATDACRVLVELARLGPQRDMIALAMGEAGLATRILAPKFGAYLTFACLDPHCVSAPGQPTLAELRDLYRWDHIGPATRVYGVVGWPVTHSLSPAVHNAAMTAADVDGVFVPLPVRPGYRALARFLDFVTTHTELAVMGLSVTSPHKENAFRWLRERGHPVSAPALRCGSVNTLVRLPPNAWEGDNTDITGIRDALRAAGPDALRGQRVVVLGAGGAARAAIVALRDQCGPITVCGRTAARARRLAREMGCAARPWEVRETLDTDVLVNCTPVGQLPAGAETPVSDSALRPGMVVFDAVYQPALTRLLRAAQERGCLAIRGVEMFIGQAAAQYALWHRTSAPREAMRAALSAAQQKHDIGGA